MNDAVVQLDITQYPYMGVITSKKPIAKKKPSTPNYKAGTFYDGSYIVYSVDKMQTLYDAIIAPLTSHQSLMLGVPKNGSSQGAMTTIKHKRDRKSVV